MVRVRYSKICGSMLGPGRHCGGPTSASALPSGSCKAEGEVRPAAAAANGRLRKVLYTKFEVLRRQSCYWLTAAILSSFV
jgi:hypothetical protein